MPVCEIHRCDMKLIPAGVSKKTGKPYNAFYACQVSDCTFRPPGPSASPTPDPVQSSNGGASSGLKTNPSDKSIIRQVAFKGAIELVAAGKVGLEQVHGLTDKFDRIIQATALPSLLPPQEELPVIQQGEDIDVESIPF